VAGSGFVYNSSTCRLVSNEFTPRAAKMQGILYIFFSILDTNPITLDQAWVIMYRNMQYFFSLSKGGILS
jgi:hypothetical protein